MKIGFIGQGYIGKNYADDFEERGHLVVRYSLEEPHVANKGKIAECDVVFIAVPTPTTKSGSDASIVAESLSLLRDGAIAVIKSTVLPGTTAQLAKDHPNKFVLHSPEFLSKATAAHDARNPKRNIVGVAISDDIHKAKAELVLSLLPKAPFTLVCTSGESEFLKYVNNTYFYAKVVYMNLLYDMAKKLDLDWSVMRDAIAAEPWIGSMHLDPVHKTGRGAGGICLIKDFAAFAQLYRELHPDDTNGLALLNAIEDKNLELLRSTNKDQQHVQTTYE